MSKHSNVDEVFLKLLTDWTQLSAHSAEQAVMKILNNSGEYLSDEQMKAVSNFHDLYFEEDEVSNSKEVMNREVDDLIDAIRSGMGEDEIDAIANKVDEDEDAKKTRLSLSGVQKSLETIIQLEDGLRDKLIPVLTSMQFEDTIKQYLSRLVYAWKTSLESDMDTPEQVAAVAESIALRLGTQYEREVYYPKVLQREAPEEEVEEITFLDSLT